MNAQQYISERDLFEDDDRTIVDIVCFDDKITLEEKINICFELYDRSPQYGICFELNPIYKELNSNLKELFWSKYKGYLKSGNDEQKKHIKYSIWVDYFEDAETTDESWDNLVKGSKEDVLREILSVSGPAPFEKKDELYLRMISKKENHQSILESLVGSFFDVYGRININRARIILPTLKVDRTSIKYIELNDKLTRFDSKGEYWDSLK